MLKIASVNVNGVRAAARKNMGEWVQESNPDVLCLQEVRAPTEDLVELSTKGPLAVATEQDSTLIAANLSPVRQEVLWAK